MRLSRRDIQYEMNEARNIVNEKRAGIMAKRQITSTDTLNPVDENVLATAANKVKDKVKNTAKKVVGAVRNATQTEADTAIENAQSSKVGKALAQTAGLKRNRPGQNSGRSPKFHPTQK